MATHKALVLKSTSEPISLHTTPKPTAGPGETVVRVLSLHIAPYAGDIFTGKRPFPLSFPLTPGSGAIGRIDTIGPDATTLVPGQLVFIEPTIRGRDEPAEWILLGFMGGISPESRKLMDGHWRNGTMAEFVKVPLENVYPLDEQKLLGPGGLGYKISDLPLIPTCLVPFGGLVDSGVQPGDTVIVAPATGKFSGAAVLVAVSMGAHVIAAGRNEQSLKRLTQLYGDKVTTVKVTGDVDQDTVLLKTACGKKGADVYIDLCPPAAGVNGDPSYIKAGINALRTGGTLSVMGGIMGDISIPYSGIMIRSIKVKGKFMYERSDVVQLIKMIENGNLKLGKHAGVEVVGEYGLDKIQECLKAAEATAGWGPTVALVPTSYP